MAGHYAYEQLGLFYLGRELAIDSGKPSDVPLLLKSKDFTTHAAIIGMTGSGKTGLGIGLIEEAIMDNIPSIIIDPKGDMANLLLTFENLAPADFAPWIDPAEAAKKELTVEAYAEQIAASWEKGLASFGQGRERIQALRQKTRFAIYTPGSFAGLSISVLSSFSAPSAEILNDTDTLNGLVNSTTTSLLALIDVKGDPLQSREHILLSSLLLYFWRKGENLSLESLIGYIVSPPFAKIGVFALDTFFNQADRMALAMNLNNILASPTFTAWTQGQPLDIQRILYGEDGMPQTAIFSISHLSDSERMFFVTMLLNQVIGWMRRQQGTASLKALLYMDEIFGFFPPIANPPSKKPMLLLLKQARAFGLGVVLATQNPVDLDYKGLANIGTWFVGRLQTTQDQERVLEGIVGASEGKLDRNTVKNVLSALKGRQFLLTSAHIDDPLLFETRWTMSYLKGPITNDDIKKLVDRPASEQPSVSAAPAAEPAPAAAEAPAVDLTAHPPMIAKGVEQLYYLHNLAHDDAPKFEPWLTATASVRFYNAAKNIDVVNPVSWRLYLGDDFQRADWQKAEENPYVEVDCVRQPPSGSQFYSLPAAITEMKDLSGLQKSFVEHLYQYQQLELFRVSALKLESRPGESEGDFRVRLSDMLREQKDKAIEDLKVEYGARQKNLEEKLTNALNNLEKEKVDVKAKATDTLISFGVAVVGAFLGRSAVSITNISRVATGVKSAGKVLKERADVQNAEQEVLALQQELSGLAADLERQGAEIAKNFAVEAFPVETFTIKPRRSDVFDVRTYILWEMVHQPA